MVVPIYAHTVVTAGCCAPLCKSTCCCANPHNSPTAQRRATVHIHITHQQINSCNTRTVQFSAGLLRGGGMWVSETLLWVSETLLLSLCRRPTPSWLLLAEKICWHDVPCPVLWHGVTHPVIILHLASSIEYQLLTAMLCSDSLFF